MNNRSLLCKLSDSREVDPVTHQKSLGVFLSLPDCLSVCLTAIFLKNQLDEIVLLNTSVKVTYLATAQKLM